MRFPALRMQKSPGPTIASRGEVKAQRSTSYDGHQALHSTQESRSFAAIDAKLLDLFVKGTSRNREHFRHAERISLAPSKGCFDRAFLKGFHLRGQ